MDGGDPVGGTPVRGSRARRHRVGGRFVAIPDEDRALIRSEDTSWIVTSPVDGGPIDGSVIRASWGTLHRGVGPTVRPSGDYCSVIPDRLVVLNWWRCTREAEPRCERL
ncbi:hypothetical protein M5689_024316 [Euphorbia peplus]|nr:hypothetical protein M5689_024316 [Euphorbia peplus]